MSKNPIVSFDNAGIFQKWWIVSYTKIARLQTSDMINNMSGIKAIDITP